jgi:hypothetical protein
MVREKLWPKTIVGAIIMGGIAVGIGLITSLALIISGLIHHESIWSGLGIALGVILLIPTAILACLLGLLFTRRKSLRVVYSVVSTALFVIVVLPGPEPAQLWPASVLALISSILTYLPASASFFNRKSRPGGKKPSQPAVETGGQDHLPSVATGVPCGEDPATLPALAGQEGMTSGQEPV